MLGAQQQDSSPWSKKDADLRSKTRTEPSAETLAKTPTPPQAMSYTSLSCAISCVSTTPFCGQCTQRSETRSYDAQAAFHALHNSLPYAGS